MHRYILILFILAGAKAASAQSSTAQAEALFEQAKSLMAEGKFAEACSAFDSSQQMQPAITTLLNQGSCREKNHQFATAWGHFIEVERLTRNASDEESLTFRRVASQRAAKLRPILSTITIEVPDSARLDGLAISRGNTVVSVGEWNHPLPIDGGTYTIVATAPGHEPWQVTLSIGWELDVKQIKVPRLNEKKVEAPALVTATTAHATPTPPPSKVPYVIGGSAILLGGLAIGVELWGQSNYSDAENEFDDARQRELWRSAKTKRYLAQGLGVAALAAGGVAVWRYLVDRRERRNAVEVTPIAGHGTAGVSIEGSW